MKIGDKTGLIYLCDLGCRNRNKSQMAKNQSTVLIKVKDEIICTTVEYYVLKIVGEVNQSSRIVGLVKCSTKVLTLLLCCRLNDPNVFHS